MNRRKARRLILQILFQQDLCPASVFEDVLSLFPAEFLIGIDLDFVKAVVNGIMEKKDMIDNIISKHAVGWKLDRMGVVDRNIIRFSVYEVMFAGNIPVSISINEAVELTKLFSDEKSKSFVNGVLSKIFREEGLVSAEQ